MSPGPAKADLMVDQLVKQFNGRKVLDNISFSLPEGQALALIGHNGSGKSTLLRCCMRLIEPSSGNITLLGREISPLHTKALRKVRAQVGFIFQRHNLVQRLCTLTNVLHGVQARKKGPRTWLQCLAPQQDRQEAMEQLNRVGLAHLAGQRADKLSGGESQRVAIARALMQHPKMIVADEPVASLDPKAGDQVMQLFLRLIKEEGITLLFVSHNLEHALKYGDRVIGLSNGKTELDSWTHQESLHSLRAIYG